MTTTANALGSLAWVRFENGHIVLVNRDNGTFETVVRVFEPSEDQERFLDQLSELVTGSEGGIEQFSWRGLDNGLHVVSGRITDWAMGEDNEVVEFKIVDPAAEGFVEALAQSLHTNVVGAEHALETLGFSYGEESVITTTEGREIRCPAYPLECDYVRITAPGVIPLELAYWSSDEWAEAPMEVMGAILGAARNAGKQG